MSRPESMSDLSTWLHITLDLANRVEHFRYLTRAAVTVRLFDGFQFSRLYLSPPPTR